jgi:N-hydroxyarylamine O-acetyltransferase
METEPYFARVGWSGSASVTYDTLAGLLRAHVERIPFENLDVLLGRRIRLDLPSVVNKLVHRRRGGYCFEHATLFAAVLEALGFEVTRHTARVVLVVPRTQAARSHMLLTVTLPEGRFVVDPGFGGHTPRAPVPVVEGARVRVDRDTHWIVRDGAYWVLRANTGERDIDCWASTLEQDNLIDFELGNHYTATHPDSAFVNRLMLRAFTPEGRVHVMNREVTQWRDGVATTHTLASRDELRRLLADAFGIDLPEAASLRVPLVPEWSSPGPAASSRPG